MLRAYTTFSREIDHPSETIAELLSSLDLSVLLSFSIGIVFCYEEYVENGFVSMLSESVPFDVIGCTTRGNATNHGSGHLCVSMLVLTSDTIEFSVSMTNPLEQDQKEPIQKTYHDTIRSLNNKPEYIMAIAPSISRIGGSSIFDYLFDQTSLPMIGGFSTLSSDDYHESYVFYNTSYSRKAMVLLVMSGPIEVDVQVRELESPTTLNERFVMESLSDLCNSIQVQYEKSALLCWSCISRNEVLETTSILEMKQIEQNLNNVVPFVFSYMGDIICSFEQEDHHIVKKQYNKQYLVSLMIHER